MKLYIIMKFSRRKFFYHPNVRRLKALYVTGSVLCVVLLAFGWRLQRSSNNQVQKQSSNVEDLEYLRKNRDLRIYLEQVELLIEPSLKPCTDLEGVPLVSVVGSQPAHHQQRMAIRETWARAQPTFFFMGLDVDNGDNTLIDNYMEAKKYDDIVVYDFRDHRHNDSIKTALMLKWILLRCPQAEFLMKNMDNVVVNPMKMAQVLRENEDAKLLGYIHHQVAVDRRKTSDRYVPQWLIPDDIIPKYLDGNTYIISGEYIRIILKAAKKIPLINLEDVFFTHLVASNLKYELTHDERLAPNRPWPHMSCAYWSKAIVKVESPEEMQWVWSKLDEVGVQYVRNETVCRGFFTRLFLNFVFWH